MLEPKPQSLNPNKPVRAMFCIMTVASAIICTALLFLYRVVALCEQHSKKALRNAGPQLWRQVGGGWSGGFRISDLSGGGPARSRAARCR